MRFRVSVRIAAAALSAALLAPPVALAQGYPVKPVRIVLPFLGGTDFVARWLALKLPPAIGQPLVVEPRLGAGGNIAHEAVARSPADGYTLLMAAPTVVINPNLNPKVGFDPLRDYAPIALLAFIPNVLVVHPSVPARSLRELQQLARKFPGKLSFGSGGVNSATHLAGEFLKSLTGTQIVHVPYKSATIALVGATSGEVDIVIAAVPVIAPYVQQGRLRPLAILDHKRVGSLPGVPTSAEAGIPQFVAVNWYVLLAPAGTPRDIIDRLNAESVKIMQSAETRERFATVGADTTANTPEQTAEFLRTEHARWGKLIKDAGIRAD